MGPLAALGRECLGLAATHLPSLAERLPVVPVAPDDDDRASFFDAVMDVVRSRPRPTTLVLDDIQWAGGTTLALLQRTAQVQQSPPIRVLATCRPPLTAEMPLDAIGRRPAGYAVVDRDECGRIPGSGCGAPGELAFEVGEHRREGA